MIDCQLRISWNVNSIIIYYALIWSNSILRQGEWILTAGWVLEKEVWRQEIQRACEPCLNSATSGTYLTMVTIAPSTRRIRWVRTWSSVLLAEITFFSKTCAKLSTADASTEARSSCPKLAEPASEHCDPVCVRRYIHILLEIKIPADIRNMIFWFATRFAEHIIFNVRVCKFVTTEWCGYWT